MNHFRRIGCQFAPWLWLAAVLVIGKPFSASAVLEDTFPVLQIGTHSYTNVTVTTKTKTYVMIMHSAGLANFKVVDLPADVKQMLGYGVEAEKSKASSGAAVVWAREKLAGMKGANVETTRKQLQQNLTEGSARMQATIQNLDRRTSMSICGGIVFVYLMWCFCLMKICQKAGSDPGVLIWLPLIQVFPLLKAAKMSPAWVLGVFGLTQIVWCFKIATARGKSPFVGFCLLFPLTNFFAFLYLTFSDGAAVEAKEEKSQRSGIMTLETA